MKKNLIKILLDTIPVFLGVLIAILVGDMKERADNERYLKRIFSSIEQELETNMADLDSVLPKQHRLLDTLAHYIANESVSLTDIIIRSNGIQLVSINKTSWKNLINAKIELIDYDIVSKLSNIEVADEFLKLKMNKMMDFLYDNIEATDEQEKRMLIIHLTNLMESEQSLLKAHREYLEREK